MGSVSLRYGVALARELFALLMLSALLLVTGCGSSSDYTPRAELAPPPPFMSGPQAFGPEVPAEIAMLMMMDEIMPSSGPEIYQPETYGPAASDACFNGSSFVENENPVAFTFGSEPVRREKELSFSSLHSSSEMSFHFTFALPSPVKNHRASACH